MANSPPGKSVRPLRSDGLTTPRPDRFTADDPGFEASIAAHDDAQKHDDIGYLEPTSGLFVMTAGYLADRGYCCERGCRHCPYQH